MPDVVDLDAVAVARAHLLGRAGLVQAFGGGDGWVTSDNEPPYPHVALLDTPGGTDRTLDWLVGGEVTVETYGDLDGTPGKAELRRLHTLVLQELRDLPKQPVTDPAAVVITGVTFPGARGYVPLPTGQPRYLSRVVLWGHPPRV